MASILIIVSSIVSWFFRAVYLLLLLRFIFSWINYSRGNVYRFKGPNPVEHLVLRLTDPLVGPFEGMFPAFRIDLSPVVVFLILRFFLEPLVSRILIGF